MENKILGLHHVTAIAGSVQENYDFYTKTIGQRLVKKTVNFDDPGTYHFYYGNEVGSPGSILTFFPWQGMRKGAAGTGMISEIGYSVPKNSLGFWENRFKDSKILHQSRRKRFGEELLSFEDKDGLKFNLVIPKNEDNRKPWTTGEVNEDIAIKGFHSVVLMLKDISATARVLTEILGYELLLQEGNRYRFITNAIDAANVIDLLEVPEGSRSIQGAGTNHHVAFRVKDEKTLMHFREKIIQYSMSITEKIDRNYFYSLYFREPGGVLFELATDNPGFDVDEPVSELGTHLKLPAQYEKNRPQIEKTLPQFIQ